MTNAGRVGMGMAIVWIAVVAGCARGPTAAPAAGSRGGDRLEGRSAALEATGACLGDADQAALATQDIPRIVETCVRDHLTDTAQIDACVVRETGLSNGCATCFGENARCALDRCLVQCAFSSPEACQRCRVAQGCTEAFETCAGIAEDPLSPAPTL